MSIIEFKNVTKFIGKNKIVDDVSFQFQSGAVTGLKGVNGSGKTMLMRLAAGLILPTKGEILIDGKRLGKDITFPESIGVLIENPAFLDTYTGYGNLKLLASIRKRITDEDIVKALERVGLNPGDSRKYRKYSLGMKQRLGIAAAILEKPEIILLDEPMNALDDDGVEMTMKIMSEEKARGAAILLSCHDFQILEEASDKIYLVKEGKLSPY